MYVVVDITTVNDRFSSITYSVLIDKTYMAAVLCDSEICMSLGQNVDTSHSQLSTFILHDIYILLSHVTVNDIRVQYCTVK